MKILVVEDTPINQTMAKLLLEGEGHEAMIAARGSEALAHLKIGRFDLALMDLDLPDMSGVEVAKMVRASETGRAVRTPIIALSGSKSPELERQCLQAGMDGFWVKPIRAEFLTSFVSSAMRERMEKSPEAEKGLERTDEPPTFDLEEALVITGGDRRLLAELASMFLNEMPVFIGKLSLALSGNERENISRLAHRLAGSSANFGQTLTGLLARRLENAANAGEDFETLNKLFDSLTRETMRLMKEISAFLEREYSGG